MKKIALLTIVGALALSGCAGYTSAGNIVRSDKTITKSGEASCTRVLFATFGDCSIATAMKNGGVSNAVSVDHKTTLFLGIFAKSTTIVSGE